MSPRRCLDVALTSVSDQTLVGYLMDGMWHNPFIYARVCVVIHVLMCLHDAFAFAFT